MCEDKMCVHVWGGGGGGGESVIYARRRSVWVGR